MRNILKGHEPASLTQHRLGAHCDYDNYEQKDELRQALAREQHGLCCYCMGRIQADGNRMKIEHWRCQDRFPASQLDYSNLLGACMGGQNLRPSEQHCDTRKGNQDLSRNPALPAHCVERLIQYNDDGTIRSTDPVFDSEINDVLNLNTPVLKNNRKAALTGFLQAAPKNGTWDEHWLKRWLDQWNGDSGDGDLQPYCQIVVYWLRKRLKRA